MMKPPPGPLVRLERKQVIGITRMKSTALREAEKRGDVVPGIPKSENGLVKFWYEYWFQYADQIALEDAQAATAERAKRSA